MMISPSPRQIVEAQVAHHESRDSSAMTASVNRAVAILSALAAEPGQTLTQLTVLCSIPKSTTFRLLRTLQSSELVRREGTRWVLGTRFIHLSGKTPELAESSSRNRIREVAMPFLLDLYGRTSSTIHLTVLQDSSVVYLEKLYGHRRVASPSVVGGSFPALRTAAGKAMLAQTGESEIDAAFMAAKASGESRDLNLSDLYRELQVIRQRGYATDIQEAQNGLCCVAAVINEVDGIRAAISVSSESALFDEVGHSTLVKRAAININRVFAAEVDSRFVPTYALLSRSA